MGDAVTSFLQAIHLMDLLLVALIGGLAIYGFMKGTANIAIILISTYLGFAVASIYYVPFGRLVGGLLNISLSRVAEILAFLLINLVMAVLLAALLFSVMGNLQVPGRVGACIDRPAGMFIGFATGIVIAAILVILLSVPYEKYEEIRVAGGQAPIFTIFHTWYRDSLLGPTLQRLGPMMVSSIAPLTGHRLPSLLTASSSLLLPLLWFGRFKRNE